MDFLIIFLNVSRQAFEEVGVCVQDDGTAFMRTHRFFETLDFVNNIVMETGLAKIFLVLAVTHVDL